MKSVRQSLGEIRCEGERRKTDLFMRVLVASRIGQARIQRDKSATTVVLRVSTLRQHQPVRRKRRRLVSFAASFPGRKAMQGAEQGWPLVPGALALTPP